jgi:4-amino-4-deoxy-L-arabinose transferase-like glycosyltransferase
MDKRSIETVLPDESMASLPDKLPVVARLATLRAWLLCWEIYLIVFVAAFLRLYQFNTTEFDPDEVAFFQMARYAITHGLIPATSNRASVGYFIPPATIDILMIPAAFTNDPLWGAITTAILMTVSVLLTYCFVRNYYGRVAATITALMYATLFRAVFYSRFIWNVNFLPLFVVLLFMALFWGVVARRKGWLFPALFLLGILLQLHTSGVMLIIPFVIALVLAPGTLRLRDLVLGLLSLLIIYFPYFSWEAATHFRDMHLMIQTFLHPQQKPIFDDLAWVFYQDLLNPYDLLSQHNPLHWHNILPYLGETSMLWQLAPYFAWISQMVVYLVVISMVTALTLAVWSRGPSVVITGDDTANREFQVGTNTVHNLLPSIGTAYLLRPWGYLRRYWLLLRASSYRCGLIVLLSWQIVPIIILLHHSLLLYLHYFIFLMPGPCILVGIFLAKAAEWLRKDEATPRNLLPLVGARFIAPTVRPSLHVLHYGIYALTILIIVAQFISSTVGILDIDHGNYSDGYGHRYSIGDGSMATYGYNDLRSLRNALTEADQLAQQHHLNRVYVSAAGSAHMEAQFRFLSTQMHTPITVFNSNCITLPSTAEGPAVMLMEPYNNSAPAIVKQFATATLIDKPRRSGGAPFWLYIVTPKPVQAVPYATLSINNGYDLQLDTSSQISSFNGTPWIITHWTLLHSVLPSDDITYTYSITMTHFLNRSHYANTTNQCTFTAMRAGDQLLIPFNQYSLFMPSENAASSIVILNGEFYEINPLYLQYGPFRFLTFATMVTQKEILYTPEHKRYLIANVPILPRSNNKAAKKLGPTH